MRDAIGPTPAVTATLDETAGQVGDGREEEVERVGLRPYGEGGRRRGTGMSRGLK